MEFIKAKTDTINLNIRVDEDLSIVQRRSKYEHIELYPKLCEIFAALEIPFEKFKLRNFSVASKFKINYEGIYLEFKTLPPRVGEVSDNSKKICFIQLKGEWFLKNNYQMFLTVFKKLPQATISKLEIAFDFVEKEIFLNDSMDLFLHHRDRIAKLEGENKIFFHLNSNQELGLSYSNISKEIKIYNKSEELKTNRKRDLYYEKNPEFIDKVHYRIELGFARSTYIERNLDLLKLFGENKPEKEIISRFLNVFLKNFSIEKKSKLKNILLELARGRYLVD